MKKIIFVLAVCFTFQFSSTAQSTFWGGDGGTVNDCPPGYHPSIQLICDGIRFHRNKYDCLRGFGICCTKVVISQGCIKDNYRAMLKGNGQMKFS